MDFVRDLTNRPIHPGDRIVYAVRLGSCSVALRYAVVDAVYPETSTIEASAEIASDWRGETRIRKVTLSYPDRIAVLG